MDIFIKLLKKYPFYNYKVAKILHNDLFFAINTMEGDTLIVCDGGVSEIVRECLDTLEGVLILEHPRAFPTKKNVGKILQELQLTKADHIFAIGSGGVNDICKIAANVSHSFFSYTPTALSMNGICSNNASFITEGGMKKSFLHKSASTIYVEDHILISAPIKFTGSGIMDCLAGYTAYNDFLFANKTNPELYPVDNEIFGYFHNQMQVVLKFVNTQGEFEPSEKFAMELFELLYLAGLTMNFYNSSIAFSGGEHHIAHTVESRNPHVSKNFLHGEVISAILPYYSSLQLEYSGGDYIEKAIVLENNAVNFTSIAKKLNMPHHPTHLGISMEEFQICLKQAKHAKKRPTLLSLLF